MILHITPPPKITIAIYVKYILPKQQKKDVIMIGKEVFTI